MPNIPLDKILPNPYRDFTLHPIDDVQVERLMATIHADGFWSGVVARKAGDNFEIAFGHHRIEAARRIAADEGTINPTVSIEVRQMPDRQMVRMMASENATQRGNTAAAALDAVAAVSKVLAYDLLRWDEETFNRIHAKKEAGSVRNLTDLAISYPECRGNLERGHGIGRACIAAFVAKDAFSRTQIDAALVALKESGRMAMIVTEASAKADGELRAEAEAAEAAAEAARIKKEAAKAARAAAKAADKAAADKASKDADKASKDASKKATKATEAVEEAEQAAVANRAKKVIYDARCTQLFRIDAHAETFRKIVTGAVFQSYLPVAGQFAFAESILAAIRANLPADKKEFTATDIRAECWSKAATALGIPINEMKSAPERPSRADVGEGMDLLRRAVGDFKRGIVALLRGMDSGEQLTTEQADKLAEFEATFEAGWEGLRARRHIKPSLKLVEGG